MKLDIETARKMVAAIEEDLCGRRGLRQEWEGIDAGVQREIREAWVKRIQQTASVAGDVAVGEGRSGPATKMREALEAVWYDDDDAFLAAVNEAWEGVTPATLEAMDAAAEVMAGPDPDTNYRQGLAGDLLLHAESGGRWARIVVSEHEEERLLRVLLERRIQRRKEAGNG